MRLIKLFDGFWIKATDFVRIETSWNENRTKAKYTIVFLDSYRNERETESIEEYTEEELTSIIEEIVNDYNRAIKNTEQGW